MEVGGLGSPFKVPFTRTFERTGSDDGVPFRLGFPSLRTLSHDTTPNEGSGREQMGVNRRTTASPFSLLGGGEVGVGESDRRSSTPLVGQSARGYTQEFIHKSLWTTPKVVDKGGTGPSLYG